MKFNQVSEKILTRNFGKESVWSPFGIRSGSVWDPFGIRSGSVRDPFGFHSGSVRTPFGVRSESVRNPLGATQNVTCSIRTGTKVPVLMLRYVFYLVEVLERSSP